MNLDSITHLLNEADIQFVAYDMGRRIQRIPPQKFSEFENAQTPYPSPLQKHAWLGIVGWQRDDKKQHFIWFIQLPLDEMGMINPVARDEIVRYLLQKISDRLILKNSQDESEEDKGDLPHGFTPKEESMAVFHAKASLLLNQPPSQYYQHAREYLSGKQGFDQWQFLALQGLADFIVRLDEENNHQQLINCIKNLPEIPFTQICRFLEHEEISVELANKLIQRSEQIESQDENSQHILVAVIRALAGVEQKSIRENFLSRLLDGKFATDIEVLASISGRCWLDLQKPEVAKKYLAALAQNSQGQPGFDHLLIDLLAIPGLREPLMDILRDPHRSDEIAKAIGVFFTQFHAE